MKIAPVRTFANALLALLGLLATFPLSSATPSPKEQVAKPVEVTYFFLPG